jgi:hypothetical protein
LASPKGSDTAFFLEQLAAQGPLSENTCPVADKHMEHWVRKGLEYGRRLRADNPGRFAEVLVEIGETELASVRQVVEAVVTRANGTEPVALTAAILEWHKRTFESHGLRYYGQLLDRVAYCVDFAIWIPWAGHV